MSAAARAGLLLGAVVGCAERAQESAQLLVFVDTDMPAVGDLAGDPELSPWAAIDTLRVELGGTDAGGPQDLFVPNAADWPVSFGVAPPERGEPARVRLRIRGFRASLALLERGRPSSALAPEQEVTIDRVVDVTLPVDRTRRILVVLRGDCMGAPARLGAGTTCVDADRKATPFADAFADLGAAGPPGRPARWARARDVGCAPDDRVRADGVACVTGGLTVLGDPRLRSTRGRAANAVPSFPLRVVALTPFYIDRTEITVGRFRALWPALAGAGARPPAEPSGTVSDLADCRWRAAAGADPARDALPINCVPWATARAACALLGGDLPSEAQWERAARGRERRRFPWGEAPPNCCAAAIARSASDCGASRDEPPASHPLSGPCGGIGDETPEGIFDLAGSLSEAVRDDLRPYDHGCWASYGVPLDPICEDPGAPARALRGASVFASLDEAESAMRIGGLLQTDPTVGFRCVYPGSAR